MLKKIVLRIAYWFGIDAVFYWLNQRAKRVLVFHHVLAHDVLPQGLRTGMCEDAEIFDKTILEELSKKWRFSTDVFDPQTMTVTFDDGYRNQYTTAFKLMRARNIPGILFWSGDVGKILAIDKINMWAEWSPDRTVNRGELWKRYQEDSEARGENVVRWLDSVYPFEKLFAHLPKAYCKERLGVIESHEMDEMRAAGWVIGWHTKTHSVLSRLSDHDVLGELTSPPEMRGLPMSYPYGMDGQIDCRVMRIAEDLGYPCAFANTHESPNNFNRYFMPRMHIWNADKYDMHFELSGLRFFLKHHKLLPKVSR